MPKGPRKFHFSFVKTGLTRFGGLSLLHSLCKSLGLRRFLQLYVRWPDYSYRDYHPVDLFLAHLFAIVAGTGRVESTQCLIHNGLIPPILESFRLSSSRHFEDFSVALQSKGTSKSQSGARPTPSPLLSTIGPALQCHHRCRYPSADHPWVSRRYAVGYIPKRRHGQASYAPIISSEGKAV